MLIILIFLLLVHPSFATETCNPYHYPADAIKSSAAQAKLLVERFPTIVPIKDRLAVMILFSQGFKNTHASRLNYLRCSLIQYHRQVGVNTPSDIFIWVLNSTHNPRDIPDWLNTTAFPRVNIVTIPDSTWKIPCGLIPDNQWNLRRKFDLDYYLMGRWRLTFPLGFVREMGYEYHLQLDDDAIISIPVKYNFVQRMREEKMQMAVTYMPFGEPLVITLGLPEFAYYWIKLNKYEVQGTLFQHCKPNNLQGLNSEGFDRSYYPGYFIITSVNWWFDTQPQNFLEAILRSGRDVESRWQEQAVMNMMRLLFIPEKQLWIINDIEVEHDRHKKETYQNYCAAHGIQALYHTA
jgi:hypothetical protein